MTSLRQPLPAPFDEGYLTAIAEDNWNYKPLQSVPIRDLIPTQPWVWLPQLCRLLAGAERGTAHEGIAVVHESQLWLWDGHNNLVRLAFTGAERMKVRVVDWRGQAAQWNG